MGCSITRISTSQSSCKVSCCRYHPRMEILTAVLCDSAEDYNGKLCILGTFDSIYVRRLPIRHPQCCIALRILFEEGDVGAHRFSFRMIDADGKSIFPIEEIKAEVRIKMIPENTYFLTKNLILNLSNLEVKHTGQYSLDVRINDEMVRRIPFQVIGMKESGEE